MYIDYDTSTTGLKSNDSTPVGDFNQEFTVKLSPEFDLANMMADGLSTLNLTFYDDSALDVADYNSPTQTVKDAKAAILGQLEVFIPARPAGYYGAGSTATSEQVITGAIDGIQSMSAQQLKLDINATVLSDAGVYHGDDLGIRYKATAADVLEGTNGIDVTAFADHFDADLSSLPAFTEAEYSGNEFHLKFENQTLNTAEITDAKKTAIVAALEVATDAAFTNKIANAVSAVQDVNTDRLKIKFNHDALYAATGVEDGTQLFIRYTGGADLLEASGGDKDDVGKFETSFNVQLLELTAGTFMGGDHPRINVEFTEDINAGNSDKTKIVNSLVAKKYVSGGTDVVIDIFKTSDANGDGTETREASAIDLNGSQLGIELDATKLAAYKNDSIYLEYDDTTGTGNTDGLEGVSGSSLTSFKFSVAANQFYNEIFTSGMTTSSSAVMDANTLDLDV